MTQCRYYSPGKGFKHRALHHFNIFQTYCSECIGGVDVNNFEGFKELFGNEALSKDYIVNHSTKAIPQPISLKVYFKMFTF